MRIYLFDAAYIGAIACVDLNFVACVDEKRYTDFRTCLKSSGLEGIGCSVALDAGFGVCHFENDLEGHFGVKDSFCRCVADNFYDVAFFHKVGAGNESFVDRNLLECLLVHEDVVATFAVEELIGTMLDAYVFKLFADVEAAFEHTAVNHVLELRAHERVALAGLHMKEFDYEI